MTETNTDSVKMATFTRGVAKALIFCLKDNTGITVELEPVNDLPGGLFIAHKLNGTIGLTPVDDINFSDDSASMVPGRLVNFNFEKEENDEQDTETKEV